MILPFDALARTRPTLIWRTAASMQADTVQVVLQILGLLCLMSDWPIGPSTQNCSVFHDQKPRAEKPRATHM